MKIGARVVMMVVAVAVTAAAAKPCKDIGNNCHILSKYCNQLDALLYCPLSCGACEPESEPVAEPAVEALPVKRVVERESECKDELDQGTCAAASAAGKCGDVGSDCALTCGLCFASPTPAPTPATGADRTAACRDILPQSTCSYYAGYGVCHQFKGSCQATCGYCMPDRLEAEAENTEAKADCASRKTNVCIVVDSAVADSDEEWLEVADFTKALIKGVEAAWPGQTNVKFSAVFPKGDMYVATRPTNRGWKVARMLRNSSFIKGSPLLEDGMGLCSDKFDSKLDNVAVVISDGTTRMKNGDIVAAGTPQTLLTTARTLKEAGAKVYTIGMHDTTAETEELLRGLSRAIDSVEEHHTSAADVADFQAFARALVADEC